MPTIPQLKEELHDARGVNLRTFASASTHGSSLGETSHQSELSRSRDGGE
jgi:hypothetical protein